MPNLTLRRGIAASGAVVVALALTACGTPPWAMNTPTPVESAAPSASVTEPSPSITVPPPVPNDLSSGSTQRTITAGAVTATINYWSTLRLDKWTPNALKPITLSLVATLTPASKQKVYIQSATMTAVPANGSQTFSALAPQADQAATTPGYLAKDPYSYSQTFNTGSVPDEATYVTLNFQYDFLIQTTPTSTEYQKQTATDSVTVAIAPQPAG